MKKLAVFLVFMLLVGCAPEKTIKEPVTQTDMPNHLFHLEFRQDDRTITPLAKAVQLKKKPFWMVVYFKKNGNKTACFNFNFDSQLYNLTKKGKDIKELSELGGYAFAENLFNKDNFIFISGEGWNVWYYENSDEHRFKELKISGEYIIAKRFIDSYYIIKTRKTIPISESKEKKLYVVYANVKYLGNFKWKKLGQDFVAITFTK